MVRMFALVVLVSAGFASIAEARQIRLTCDVVDDHSGEATHRILSINTDSHSVRDEAILFRDGITSPLASNLEEFVQLGDDTITWGNRRKDNKLGAGTFTLDLHKGTYDMTSRFRGRLAHGACQQMSADV